MSDLTHFDGAGQAHMVDVGDKKETKRVAVASGTITMYPETLSLIQSGNSKKGDVLGVARIAAIQASKKTSELIFNPNLRKNFKVFARVYMSVQIQQVISVGGISC